MDQEDIPSKMVVDSYPPKYIGGTCVSSYVIIDEIGKGVFGRCFLAVCNKTNRSVAVKVLRNSNAYVTQAEVERRILIMLKAVDIPVVKILDSFFCDGYPALVFELLSQTLGYYLDHKVFDQRLSLGQLQSVSRQLMNVLVYLASPSIRIIHGDLKPDNIMLCTTSEEFIATTTTSPCSITNTFENQNIQIKLIDFGSSCFEYEQVHSYVQSRRYRAPEVYLHGGCYTPALDMWSFGCILFELYAGKPLFTAKSSHGLFEEWDLLLGPVPKYMYDRSKRHQRPTTEESTSTTSSFPDLQQFRRRLAVNQSIISVKAKLEIKLRLCYHRKELFNSECALIDLIARCLTYDPILRVTAGTAMAHTFFKTLTNPSVIAPKISSKSTSLFNFSTSGSTSSVLRSTSTTMATSSMKRTCLFPIMNRDIRQVVPVNGKTATQDNTDDIAGARVSGNRRPISDLTGKIPPTSAKKRFRILNECSAGFLSDDNFDIHMHPGSEDLEAAKLRLSSLFGKSSLIA